ncbi:endonuclease/exonuclease/phosphatase family protein [Hartmannibacter diazotrophicus]|uniref:endonuclease/exonuclease/phosphatase family protein n=1 Tax=Hartmannibacter diazotrophicus TaxID=1482074 RepID=UPI000C162693|nr:endonuclease/exonuclease/phosphatase family protein [Hartmannibacter diazotrophicus]
MIDKTVAALAVPTTREREALAALEPSVAAHDKAMAGLDCFGAVEVAGSAKEMAPLGFPLTVAAWNLERCLFPERSAAKIAASGASVVLLSEMDDGMSRSGQRHTTAAVADALGMAYAYGVEFLELGLGSQSERQFCKDASNEKGFHGNGLLAAGPLVRPFLFRLPGERVWFGGGEQSRIGERMAVGAVIETEEGPFVAVSVHLESNADSPYRERQIMALIDAVEAHAPGLPILIGGDLNTGNHIGGDFEKEGLFAASAARGFLRHSGPMDQMTTRPSLITRHPDRAMKLDWFLSRGLAIGSSAIVPSLDDDGTPLSDHDMIVCRIEGFSI